MMIFWKIIAWFATFGCFVAGVFSGTNYGDFTSKYVKAVESVSFYENDFETALPQTEIYNMVQKHFSTDNGKAKKAIVIGYDGCRADKLTDCLKDGGIRTVLAETGSHAYISYCGGVNYPRINTQKTSTAPGWCSMLTGKWADVHGVSDNSIPKSNDNLTLLTSLVESKTINSSAFYVSWGGHFSAEDATYINEKKYIDEHQLNVNFLKADDDNGTKNNVMTDIRADSTSDFIFSIFEYCDHAGHTKGFAAAVPEQVQAFSDAEKTCSDIISAIKSRPTYSQEDWLFIITSDHGGYNTWHGGPTMQERYTFIITNK